jgi:hypothetical protein
MSIPGMSGAMVGVGTGVLPDMSIPGMSAAMVGMGVAVELPDMSIPGMSAAIVGVAELPETSIPGAADDGELNANIITPKTALAAGRTTVEITMRRVTVMLAVEGFSGQVECSQSRPIEDQISGAPAAAADSSAPASMPPRRRCPGRSQKAKNGLAGDRALPVMDDRRAGMWL